MKTMRLIILSGLMVTVQMVGAMESMTKDTSASKTSSVDASDSLSWNTEHATLKVAEMLSLSKTLHRLISEASQNQSMFMNDALSLALRNGEIVAVSSSLARLVAENFSQGIVRKKAVELDLSNDEVEQLRSELERERELRRMAEDELAQVKANDPAVIFEFDVDEDLYIENEWDSIGAK